MFVALNGRQIDISKALPIKMRDVRALQRKGINVPKVLDEHDQEGIFQICLHILRKADPSTTDVELEDLTPEEFAEVWGQIAATNEKVGESDRPLPSSSTSSPSTTDGPSEM